MDFCGKNWHFSVNFDFLSSFINFFRRGFVFKGSRKNVSHHYFMTLKMKMSL